MWLVRKIGRGCGGRGGLADWGGERDKELGDSERGRARGEDGTEVRRLRDCRKYMMGGVGGRARN